MYLSYTIFPFTTFRQPLLDEFEGVTIIIQQLLRKKKENYAVYHYIS